VLRPADGTRWIHFDHLTDDEPIEKHFNRCQVLLHSGSGACRLKLLYVCRDNDRAHLREFVKSASFTPNKELADGLGVRCSSIFVSDVGGEEFYEAPAGAFAS